MLFFLFKKKFIISDKLSRLIDVLMHYNITKLLGKFLYCIVLQKLTKNWKSYILLISIKFISHSNPKFHFDIGVEYNLIDRSNF